MTLAALALAVASAQFGPQQDLGTLNDPGRIRAIDFDGDGDMDLAVACHVFGIRTLENLGGGQFGPSQGLVPFGAFADARGIAVGDLDGDGLTDIVGCATNSARLSWWPSNGDGTFETLRDIDANLTRVSTCEVRDLDRDGDLDVVSAGTVFNTVRYFENLGGGTFAAGVTLSSATTSVREIALGDLDSDGNDDVAICTVHPPTIGWFRGDGTGGFGPFQVVPANSGEPLSCLIADLDGDGREDLVATLASADRLIWFRNTASGIAPEQTIDGDAPTAFGLDAADVDFDGDIDLAVALQTEDEVRFYENQGDGTFAAPQSLAGEKPSAREVRFIDIDGDLDLDVVSSLRNPDQLVVNANESAIATTFCTSLPNSTGVNGVLSLVGTTDLAQNELTMVAANLPVNAAGFFLASQTQGMVSMPGGSEGILCLSGAIGRFVGPGQVQFSGSTGMFSLPLDATAVPQPTGFVSIAAGETWSFQAWHRDSLGGQATSNFTDAAAVAF